MTNLGPLSINVPRIGTLCVAGFYFMTSGGNPSGIERSKSAAFNAAIGFALVLSARVIANIINSAVVR